MNIFSSKSPVEELQFPYSLVSSLFFPFCNTVITVLGVRRPQNHEEPLEMALLTTLLTFSFALIKYLARSNLTGERLVFAHGLCWGGHAKWDQFLSLAREAACSHLTGSRCRKGSCLSTDFPLSPIFSLLSLPRSPMGLCHPHSW